MRGVRLKCVSTRKFKTGAISLSLICPLDKKTAALNAVLPYVLRRGTASHPDMVSIEAYLDELYGARLEPVLRKRGEVQCVGFYADFIDEAFVGREAGIIEGVTELLGEMLLMPAISGGRLRRDYVETERDNLIADIRSELNDKRSYASQRLLENMCDRERYSVPKLGRLREAEKITVATLTNHYRSLLGCVPVEVFYCGSADPERVARAVREALSGLPRRDIMPIPTNRAALSVANAMLGGAPTSKLFMNVREKLGLCYYISSGLDSHKGVLLISSGVDADKLGEARAEIEAQIAALKAGAFEDWELETAKKCIVTAYLSACDSQPAIEAAYLDLELSGLELGPDDIAALSEEVSREDVMEVFRGLTLDSVFTLRNGGGDDVQ